jgi:hypothetical protein
MAIEHFAESYPSDGGYRWKIYHYDETGNREIVDHRSDEVYESRYDADDAASDFADDHDLTVEFS